MPDIKNPEYQTMTQAVMVEQALDLYSRVRKKKREEEAKNPSKTVHEPLSLNYKDDLISGN